MQDNGYKYIHKLTQFVTTLNSRRNCSIYLIPKKFKNSDFLSILYSKPLLEFKKPKFETGDRIHISKFDLPFRKGCKPQFTKELFQIVAISSKKPSTYTKKDKEDEIIRGVFNPKEWIKPFNNGIVYNRLGFNRICTISSRQNTEISTIFSPEQLNLEGQ